MALRSGSSSIFESESHFRGARNDAGSLSNRCDNIANNTQTFDSSEELQKCRKRAQVSNDNEREQAKTRLTSFKKFCEFYENEHWNESCQLFDAIVIDPPSTLTRSRISGVYKLQTNETEIDPVRIDNFFFFC